MTILSKIKNQPATLFLLFSFLLLIGSFFLNGRTVDIHLHDTMIVLLAKHLFWAIVLVLLPLWAIYHFAGKILLNNWLSWIHVLATLVVLIAFIVLLLTDRVDPLETFSVETFKSQMNQKAINWIVGIETLIIGQIAFIINLVAGALKQRK